MLSRSDIVPVLEEEVALRELSLENLKKRKKQIDEELDVVRYFSIQSRTRDVCLLALSPSY